jgi:hypothetical protein
MEFATLPEWFVEDMAEVLLHASRYAPHTLAAARLDDMMLFLVRGCLSWCLDSSLGGGVVGTMQHVLASGNCWLQRSAQPTQPTDQPNQPNQVTFIGSPKHIRSPYLRSKLSEVLHAWLPQGEVNPGFRRG